VHERKDAAVKNRMLVVTDDDISGTFAFLQILPDHGNSRDLTPAQIGEIWLNYIIDRRTAPSGDRRHDPLRCGGH